MAKEKERRDQKENKFFPKGIGLGSLEERWKEKYYDKVSELVNAENEITYLRGYIMGAIRMKYSILGQDMVDKKLQEFLDDTNKRYMTLMAKLTK